MSYLGSAVHDAILNITVNVNVTILELSEGVGICTKSLMISFCDNSSQVPLLPIGSATYIFY